ncbi:cysteine-type endopeptidase activity involved in apoptotic signaling pathway, partial [Pristimantis euphronides]
MDFKKTLYFIDSQLTQEDLESLKFLCLNLLPNKKLLAIKSNLDLFEELEKYGHIEANSHHLLFELLYIIGQHSLLKTLGTNKLAIQQSLNTKRTVSLYRHMLFQLHEDITSEDQRDIVFLLNIPKKFEQNKKFLEILYYLEKNDLLSEDNLDVLENAVQKTSPDLLRKINDFKKRREIEKTMSQPVSCEDECDQTALSKEDQYVPAEGESCLSFSLTFMLYYSFIYSVDLMDKNTENLRSALTLTEQVKYPMNRKHRGYCLIINNETFMRSDSRRGTEKDAAVLDRVFTWLGLDVEIRNELLTRQIRDCLSEFSKRDHTERDCFVCCILSHGKSQEIYGTDNETIPISEVTSYFYTQKCTTLAEKPKLFFIQACQGKDIPAAHGIEQDAVYVEEKRPTVTIPESADILVGMSTVDGYYSFRHTQKGTWYIQALCENLTKMVPKGEDILSILTKVNKDVSEMEYLKDEKLNTKQMPQPHYTLRKKLVFPKPLTPFISHFQKTD